MKRIAFAAVGALIAALVATPALAVEEVIEEVAAVEVAAVDEDVQIEDAAVEPAVEPQSETVPEPVAETVPEPTVAIADPEPVALSPPVVAAAPVVEATEPFVGAVGALEPWTPETNKTSYWEERFVAHDASCYKAEGSTDHGSLTDGGKTVTLNTFNQAWDGDHWEALIIKGGDVSNNVISHPSAGVAYASPMNSGGKQSSVSHWIVCKGSTPEVPFDWDWQYPAPTCDGLVVTYPGNIPAGQANDVNIRIKNLITGEVTTVNFHNETGTWSGTQTFDVRTKVDWTYFEYQWVQVAGTNYHWEGSVICGDEPQVIAPTCTEASGTTVLQGEEYAGDVLTLITTAAEQGSWQVPFTGTLADVGTVLDVQADPASEVGLWIYVEDRNAWIVYEQGQYGGNLWSKTAFPGIPAGSGYKASAPIEDYIGIYGDSAVEVWLLYGTSTPGSTAVSSVTVGCTTYTFEGKPEQPTKDDAIVYGDWTGAFECEDTTVEETRTVSTTVYSYTWDAQAWEWVETSKTTETVETRTRDLTEDEQYDCPPEVIAPPVQPIPVDPDCAVDGSLTLTNGEHYTWADLGPFGPGEHTVTATANEGYTFEGGETTVTFTITVEPKTGYQSADPEAACFDRPEAPDPIVMEWHWSGYLTCEERVVTVGVLTVQSDPVWDEENKQWFFGPPYPISDTRHEIKLSGEELAECDFVPPVTPPTIPPVVNEPPASPPVVQAVHTAPAVTGERLATTGFEAWQIAAGAVGLAIMGLAMMVIGRRRLNQ